jgi:repressor LexA
MGITDRQQEILDCIEDFRKKEGIPPSLRDICKALGLVSPGSLIRHIRILEDEGLLKQVSGKKRSLTLKGRPTYSSIPLLGQIAAGTPILAQQNREEELPVDPALFGSSDAFAVRVRGDSMIDAQIRDGDLAVIRPQQEAQNGLIVAVLVEGLEPEATLKIFRRRKGAVELHPANPEYSPLIFRGKERSRVRILGKLVGVIRNTFGN